MIKKSGEVNENKKYVLVIKGPPGPGKTTLGYSAPNPVLIDSDGNSEKTEVEHYAHVPIISFNTIPELKEDLKSETVDDCETLILDTAGSMITYLSAYAIKLNANNGQSDGMTLNRKGWGVVKMEFIQLINYMHITLNKHVIIICHTKETVKKINGDEGYWFEMDVPGSSSVFIEQVSELMCMMEMYDGQRTLGFSPTRHYYAKSAYGIKGIINVPELKPGDPNNFITNMFHKIDAYRKGNADRAKEIREETQKRYEAVMQEVQGMVAEVEDIETANTVMKRYGEMNFPYSSRREAWILLKQKAESIGLIYDRDSKSFIVDQEIEQKFNEEKEKNLSELKGDEGE